MAEYNKDSLRKTYNKIAEDWHKDHKQDDWWIEGTNMFSSLLSSNSLVLDVGCGAGTKSRYLIEKGLKIIGIDLSDNMIKIANREISDAEFFICDLNDVEKINKSFDGIFMQAVLLHIPKKDAFSSLKRLIGLLNKKGYLYLAVKGNRDDGVDEEIKTENDYGYDYKRFFSYYSEEEINSYMQGLKLEIVYSNVSRVGKTDWIQVIGKK